MSVLVDLLEEDKPIAEQKFVCLSFVSPEKEIKNKDLYMFGKFVENYDFIKSVEKFSQFLNFISYKYTIKTDELQEQLKLFIDSEKENITKNVSDDFKNFMDKKESELEEAYLKDNSFQTSVRGLKVRGVFPTQAEAELRCKMIREVDPNHDVYVGPVGIWIPFHPEAYKTGRVEYLEKELNELMSEKNKNEESARNTFQTRVKESKVNAIQENINNSKITGNKLTQTINEKGELVSVENMNTQEKNLGINATLDEISSELFEGDDIIRDKK
jgi:tRNA(His) 5'-end guanylyltransferase